MAVVTEIRDIEIRQIEELAQLRTVEELQKEIWGVPDLDVVPYTLLVATREAGGVLIGAFDRETLVGFVYGFHSFERGQLAHHSHMLAVKRAYRNFDLGRRLKLAQREHVMKQGIQLMTWTFDPLQSLNAYFNFVKLGVMADKYLPDFYGKNTPSFLHQTGTDRLWVSWFLSTDHPKQRVDPSDSAALVQVGPDESPRRNDRDEALAGDHATIEIPADIDALQPAKMEAALRWRKDTRWAFTEALKAGYFVSGFTRETRGEQRIGKYLLTKGDLQCNE